MPRYLIGLLFVLLSPLALRAQTTPAPTDDEPEIGTPEWTEANITTLTYSTLGVRTGGTGFERLNSALTGAGYASVDPLLWAAGTGGATLIKNKFYFGGEGHILFGRVRSRGGYETYVPVFEVPLSSVAIQLNLGWNLTHRSTRGIRIIPMLGVGWGLTRVQVEPTADLLGPATFAGALAGPLPPSLRLRQTYWYALPQVAAQWVLHPERRASLVLEARVGYLLAGDREWNDRYGRLTDAPSDNPSALVVQLGIGFQLKGKPRNAMTEVMEGMRNR